MPSVLPYAYFPWFVFSESVEVRSFRYLHVNCFLVLNASVNFRDSLRNSGSIAKFLGIVWYATISDFHEGVLQFGCLLPFLRGVCVCRNRWTCRSASLLAPEPPGLRWTYGYYSITTVFIKIAFLIVHGNQILCNHLALLAVLPLSVQCGLYLICQNWQYHLESTYRLSKLSP